MAADSGGAALLYAGGQGTAVSWLLFWMSWLRHLVACANPMPPFAAALVRLDHTGATISVKGCLWWHGNADELQTSKQKREFLGGTRGCSPGHTRLPLGGPGMMACTYAYSNPMHSGVAGLGTSRSRAGAKGWPAWFCCLCWMEGGKDELPAFLQPLSGTTPEPCLSYSDTVWLDQFNC